MHRWKIVSGLVLVIVSLLWLPHATFAIDDTDQQDLGCDENTACVDRNFAEYWREQGGLPVFGYARIYKPEYLPSEIYYTLHERTNADGVFLYTTFERTRMEWHPENAKPYHVLLGLMGVEGLAQQGRDWHTFPQADPAAPHYFTETSHAIADVFWSYWSSHGLEFDGQSGKTFAESLALFGYPISEPALETNASGDTVLTQWYERARFEYHPDNPDEFKVLLGLLGTESIPVATDQMQLLNPANGATIQTLAPAFEALAPQGYEGSMHLQIATDPSFDVIVEELFVSNSYYFRSLEYRYAMLDNLEPSTHYYWRLYVDNTSSEHSYSSDVYEFTTAAVPADQVLPAPQLLSPADGATLANYDEPMRWTSNPLATYSIVSITQHPRFLSGPTTSSGNMYLFYQFEIGETIHWSVRDRNAHGWSARSETWTATITK